MYINWVNPTFAYFGFDYNPPGRAYLALAWVLSVLPSLWMPLAIARPSQLAYWVLYSTVFIPCMFVPLYAGLSEPSKVAWLMLTLFAGLGITGLSYLFPLLSFRPPHLRSRRFWFGFGIFASAVTLWVIVAFRGQFRIVSFSDIYDVRNAADDVMAGTLLNYPLMWLYGAINPFLMGWGLYHKKIGYFLAGSFGQLIVYGVLGTKASVLSIFFTAGFYFLLRGNRWPFGVNLTWSLAVLVWVLDSVAKQHDPRLAALLISYAAYNLANGPLFTTLLSGGLGLLMVILYLMPREQSEVSRKPSVSASVVPEG